MRTLNAEVNADTFFERVERSGEGVLVLDYDGTLAPLQVRPMRAQPYSGVVDSLESILGTGGTRVVVLSGRRAEEIAALLPLKRRPEIWGLDGWVRIMPDGQVSVREPSVQCRHGLQQALGMLRKRLPAATRIEAKQSSIALHWRGAPALIAARIRNVTTQAWQELPCRSDLQLVPFDGGLELRDRCSEWNVASEILSQSPDGVPAAYLGDDISDEQGFAAVRDIGLGVLVRPALRATGAHVWIRPPRELVGFLGQWNKAMKSARQRRVGSP